MAHKAPGKHYREGISMIDLFRMFPDDATAENWFAENRWPDGPVCPNCGSDRVQSGAAHPTMPYRCRDCRKRFSVKTGTVMQASNLGYQVWAIAIYLSLTSLKSVSSMKLHRDLSVTQKSAWHLAHRLRAAMSETGGDAFTGPVEVDETYVGGKRKNMSNAKRKALKEAGVGRGPVGKTVVVGIKDRDSNEVRAKVVNNTDKKTLHPFIAENTDEDAMVYTDDAQVYDSLPFAHESVKHSVAEYVRDMAHTNGVESFWSMLKRAHKGTFHKLSPKHLDRYVQEFAAKHNFRECDTETQMNAVVRRMDGRELRYSDLIADNGLSSTARA